MDWTSISERFATVRAGGTDLQKRIRSLRRRLTLLLAVVGPGLITSNVDNDAGGISTYTQAGAHYGYALLWSLIPMTIALYVTEEMCARMGVITGKGLSDLIREEFGFRPTFFVMVTGFLVDLANVVAEFAGVAAAMEIFHVSKYIAVPIAALIVWFLVLKGTYRQVEVIFFVACGFYVTYIISAVMAKPDWLLAARYTVIPHVEFSSNYLLMLTGLIGTTIAPWQFFYLQAGFVEKKVGPRQYPAGSRGRSGRQHQLHGHRFLHHRLYRRHSVRHRPARHHRSQRRRARLDPSRGPLGGLSLRLRLAERLALRRVHLAALHRARNLRRPGL